MISRFLGCAAAALSIAFAAAAPAAAADPLPAGAQLTPDASVRYGTMANGLRYAIMPNGAPKGMVSVRLVFNVGSYDETDDELGYAHFIEHMAFRSTKQMPEGLLDNRFAQFGVSLGRDQNATTGLDSTIYRVDLPTNDIAGLKATLEWMRGAADGILFTPAAVDVERGVVMAELNSRNSPQAQMNRERLLFEAPHLRSARREPGGTEASLRAARPASLQAFYDRWYRPENAFLIIAGDADEEELDRLAREHFADWKARGTGAKRTPGPAKFPERRVEALTKSEARLPSAVSACRYSPQESVRPTGLEGLRRDSLSALWTNIIGKRLQHRSAQPGSPFINAGAFVSRDLPDARVACFVAMPRKDDWKEALGAVQAEFRRFGSAGPTELELKEATDELRSRLGGIVYQAGTRVSPVLADQIAEAELSGRPFQHPLEALRSLQRALAGVTAEDVRSAFAQDWSGTGPFIFANAPTAPSRQELVAAWTANEGAAPLEAYTDQAEAKWAYTDFGTPGTVAKREYFDDPGFARHHFANGTILNFKQTNLQSGGVEIRVRFGHGERALDNETRTAATLAATVFPIGGLGRMDYEQIGSALANTTWGFTLEVEPTGFELASHTLTDQVDQQMKLLTAYVTDPGFRPIMDDKMPAAIDAIFRSYRTEPNAVAMEALEKALFPNQLSLPPREQLEAYTAERFARMLKPVLATSPIEVTVVGDIAEEAAVRAVAQSFGALPRRGPLGTPSGQGPFRRFPKTVPAPVTAYHEGPAEKAAAVLMWGLYVANPERRAEEYAIGLVSSIFQTRLLQRVRGDMGKAYSPLVFNLMLDEADEGFLAASLEATPEDIDALVAAGRAIAAELAAGKISQKEMDEAREPLVAERLQMQNRNEAWAGILSHSYRHPEAIDELVGYKADLAALTLADVRKAAATWLSRQPMVARALPASRKPGAAKK